MLGCVGGWLKCFDWGGGYIWGSGIMTTMGMNWFIYKALY